MKTIIFDIDGTLVDTTNIVVIAIRQAISQFSVNELPSRESIINTFGMPDYKIFEHLMPGSRVSNRELAQQLRDQYISEHMKNENVLLPHAYEVLLTLKERDYHLTTASNCSVIYLNDVLDTQNIRDFFTAPLCLGSVNGSVKADILEHHFSQFSKEGVYMVGDRYSDIEAARFHGIPVIGCSFGFGTEKEVQEADFKITSLLQLLDIFPQPPRSKFLSISYPLNNSYLS